MGLLGVSNEGGVTGRRSGQFRTPTPAAWAGGSRGAGGGGGQLVFRVQGVFLNSLFHSERFECAHLRGVQRVRLPGAPGIQINGPAIDPNALPPNITPSSSPGHLTPALSGFPNTGTKNGKKGGQPGDNRGRLCPARARSLTYSHNPLLPFTTNEGMGENGVGAGVVPRPTEAKQFSGRRWRPSRLFLVVHHRWWLGGPDWGGCGPTLTAPRRITAFEASQWDRSNRPPPKNLGAKCA